MRKYLYKFFPKITYSLDEYRKFNYAMGKDFLEEVDSTIALASSLGIIWLSQFSVRLVLHELLHIIGWNLKFPMSWHTLIHRLF